MLLSRKENLASMNVSLFLIVVLIIIDLGHHHHLHLPLIQVSAMRIVVQRVKSASVTVEGKKVSAIGNGIMALVGIHEDDSQSDLDYCCKRLLGAKLWDNGTGGMWRHSVKQKGHELLCVSQFTLYGTLTKKNQPDYKRAMKAVPAEAMYNQFLNMLRDNYEPEKISDGVFGALMDVELINDGPVTIVIESDPVASSQPSSSTTTADTEDANVQESR